MAEREISFTLSINEFNKALDEYIKFIKGTGWPSYPTAQTMWWTYPDGSKSSIKPRDGQVSRHNSGNTIVEYMWDDIQQQWHSTGAIFLDDPVVTFNDVVIELRADKCECGSEKVNSPIHSSWCPKYTK